MSVRQRPYRTQPASFVISAVCIFVTGVIQLAPSSLSQTELAILLGAYYKAFIAAGEWWRLLTVGFVHVSVIHLFVNMMSLSVLGRVLEPALKPLKFCILLFGSVIGGSVFLFCTSGNTVGVGLSGGLYGCLAAYIYLVSEAGAMKNPQVRYGVIQTVVMNLLINFLPGVAWRAHFGGAITGLLLIMCLNPRKEAQDVKRNALVALAVLCVISVVACRRSMDLSQDNYYLKTDFNILEFEKNHGMSSYVSNLAERLDKRYDISYLELLFR